MSRHVVKIAYSFGIKKYDNTIHQKNVQMALDCLGKGSYSVFFPSRRAVLLVFHGDSPDAA